MSLTAPEKLNAQHILNKFSCGEEALNSWLKHRAHKNEETRASRTYVVCADNQVIGYYSLAVGAVTHAQSSSKVRRNMPDPVPVMILGRLAVDTAWQGHGIGQALLRDALLRTVQVSEFVGIRAILVHALSEAAKQFYLAHGFHVSPIDPMMLMVTLHETERALNKDA